jgi:hypothetical protein
MVHVPVNHPLQPLYRLIAGLIGAYLIAFGVVGIMRTAGFAFFAQQGLPSALGLHANRAFAILSIVVGVVLLVGAVIGGNLDQRINLVASVVFFGAGLLMLTLLQTSANFLGFTPATCVVSFLIGMALLLSGLYGKTGNLMDVWREEDFRHQIGPDPERHRMHSPNSTHDWEHEPHASLHERARRTARRRPQRSRINARTDGGR